jgi:UDPglucose 6-dehydrogenase
VKIGVIGTGYVGLVSGVCLAAKGHQVTCLDVSPQVVEQINRGKPHIYEKDLETLLQKVLESGCFKAAPASVEALSGADIILLAVGTPSTEGRIDLRQIEAASRLAGKYLRHADKFCSVVVKSTVVPGTTDTAVRGWLEAESGMKAGAFGLGMNPEFLREGDAVADFMEPDRIVLGCETDATWEALNEVYKPWQCEKIRVNSRTAEMIKYANNAILATQISMVNELANIAAAVGGIDIYEVMKGVHTDERWSPVRDDGRRVLPGILSYLWPGCGFGGSCFPKDVQALRTLASESGIDPLLLNAVLSINEEQPGQVTRILETVSGKLAGRRVLLLGLAFKPGTDDVRESASRKVLLELAAARAKVVAHDPMALENARRLWNDLPVDYSATWKDKLDPAEIIIIATAWDDYRALAGGDNRECLKGKVVFDARRCFSQDDFPGSVYLSIGNRPRGED